jgi:DNA-binding response OmpR family regulator
MSTPDLSSRVLMVEDDLALSAIVVRHLRARGHDARAAASVEDAR